MKKYSILICILALFTGCGDSKKSTYKKSPLDDIITKRINDKNFSVILADMNYEEATDKYMHKYQVVTVKDSAVINSKTQKDSTIVNIKNNMTDWKSVTPEFFETNVENLGMTVLSKKDGVLDKIASPAGYDQYVGNERYGNWKQNNSGTSFWVYYGQYRMMSSLFHPGYNYSYSSWNNYDRNYRGRSAYYGSGSDRFGTSSNRNTNSSWSNKSSGFKSKVRSKVSRSTKARAAAASKTSKSGSRYSSSSSSRSRGGGSGK